MAPGHLRKETGQEKFQFVVHNTMGTTRRFNPLLSRRGICSYLETRVICLSAFNAARPHQIRSQFDVVDHVSTQPLVETHSVETRSVETVPYFDSGNSSLATAPSEL